MDKGRRIQKTRIGVVVSDKMEKTVVVRVDNLVKHSQYKKFIKRSVTCKVHDETNSCSVGDRVLIVESRPISRDKRWRIREILDKQAIV